MNSKDAVGRKIVAIEQTRYTNRNTGKPAWHLEYILLDNGTRLRVTTIEGEGDYFHELTAHKRDDTNATDE